MASWALFTTVSNSDDSNSDKKNKDDNHNNDESIDGNRMMILPGLVVTIPSRIAITMNKNSHDDKSSTSNNRNGNSNGNDNGNCNSNLSNGRNSKQ